MKYEGIKVWLETSGNFQDGAALYACHGTNQALKDLFNKGEYSFSKKKLRSALEELLQQSLPTAKPAPVSSSFIQNRPKTVTKTPENVTKAPHPEVNGRLRALLDERTMLHAQLEYAGPMTRLFHCLRIVELTKLITAIYFNLEKPEEQPTDFSQIADRAQLKQELLNMRALRAKLRKNPKRQAELPALEEKINTVSQLLKQTQND
ncbi:hypothetical protein GU926_08205 [Nibribacter ruber]|uniref:Uncharacterized protein n=1 Tax=Nibribacter ruber TaxID=2698458 RepID=A0A6P1NZJ7_9BACT|nr:hypothetical protein [Nibribacter ruber]QHL87418.1 hypothetical protein GU926_08205 [Nibribacter ruber]